MNVLLLRPVPGNEKFGLGPFFRIEPLGLEYIAAALEARGHVVTLADLRFSGSLASQIAAARPSMVGIAAMHALETDEVVALARLVRALSSEVPIVIGGHTAAAYPEPFLVPEVRAVVLDDGERALPRVCDALERGAPLTAVPGLALHDGDGGILVVDPEVEQHQKDALTAWRAGRNQAAVDAALAELARVAASDENIMDATIAAARAGVTTGEWAQALRDVFGSYRGPTGVGESAAIGSDSLEEIRDEVERVSDALGRRLKILVGKPGLDGHSNGAEQIAVAARDAGMEVVYEGIRLTPAQIAASALQEGVHVVGLSILSGSHRELIPSVIEALNGAGVGDVPVIVGGIIPVADEAPLREAGVAAVYTPKDFDITRIMRDVVALVAERNGIGAAA